MTCAGVDFPTATVHDSFGCTAGDMDVLFEVVRGKFVEFYETDPIRQILVENESEDLMPEPGDLDIKGGAEFTVCFCLKNQ